MKNFTRALVLVAAAAVAGCAVRLDLNPALDIPESRAIKNTDDLQQVLTSAYASLGSRHFLGGSIKVWPDVLSDQIVINPSSPHQVKENNLARRIFDPSDSLIINTWAQGYLAVNLANHVIAKIEAGSLSGTDYNLNKDRMLGEAFFIRGVAFFELARFFAPAYTDANAGLPAIPMPLTPSLERREQTVATVGEVYSQAKADLVRAASLLPFIYTNTNQKVGPFSVYGNATGAAAKAYHARICFQQGGVFESEAARLINEVIGQPDTIRPGTFFPANFYMVSSNTTNMQSGAFLVYQFIGRSAPLVGPSIQQQGSELVFQILNRGDQDFSRDIFFRYSYDPNLPGTNPRYILADTFRAVHFTPVTLDERFQRYIRAQPLYNGRFCMQKYINSNGIFSIPVIRSAELLLTRARVNFNRALTISDPVQKSALLRQVLHDMFWVKRRTGRLPGSSARPMDSPSISYRRANDPADTDFLTLLDRELNIERGRELFSEGDRLHDFRRRGIALIPGNKQQGSENIPDVALPLDKPILPIPLSETSSNSSLNR